jgi:dTMP kinase
VSALPPELRRTLPEVARDYIAMVMHACRGNQTNAARVLGIDRKTLARHLDRWGIKAGPAHQVLQPGSLVVFEGIDGSGLTTQAQLLVEHLNARGHNAVYTSEPSGGPVGKFIRHLLAQKTLHADARDLRTLSLLFAADRTDHFNTVVAPALASGTTVVSDRWYHSALAYQRTGVDRHWILGLHRHTRTPDVTVILDVRPEVGQARRAAAQRASELFHDPSIQRGVVDGYRATVAELRIDGERIEVIDGERPVASVASAIRKALGAS